MGYEDRHEHEALGRDPWRAVLAEKWDPRGAPRARERERGKALAGKRTLNRLELSAAAVREEERAKKSGLDFEAVDRRWVEILLQAHRAAPRPIVLDLDNPDDRLQGEQAGRFFHGYSGHACYLPLYIFCGERLLCARLRVASIDGAAGSQEELERIVGQIRQAWPEVQLIVRGDAGFCREERMAWCEATPGDYVLGWAKSDGWKAAITAELHPAAAAYQGTGRRRGCSRSLCSRRGKVGGGHAGWAARRSSWRKARIPAWS